MRYHIRFSRLARSYEEVVVDYLARQTIEKDEDARIWVNKYLIDGHILDFTRIEDQNQGDAFAQITKKYPEARLISIMPL